MRSTSLRTTSLVILAFLSLLAPQVRAADQSPALTVGMEGVVEIALPGPALEAKPVDDKAPLVLRIASTRPWGSKTMYDLRYMGLEPGRYDLKDYLLRTDGSSTDDLPSIPVQVDGILPAEHDGALVDVSEGPLRVLGAYKWLMGLAVVAWIALLVPLVRMYRRRRHVSEDVTSEPAAPSLEDKLRPLVERAAAGTLNAAEQGELERLLLQYWCKRRDLGDLAPVEALRRLRRDPEAGPLLQALEDWLHRPHDPAATADRRADVAAMLAPYRGESTGNTSATGNGDGHAVVISSDGGNGKP